MPLVSVVVPAYNVEGSLGRTLDSVSGQSFDDFECIVVEDGSSDSTLKIIRKWRARDRRIRLIQHRTTSGVATARNSGLRAALGQFVTFLGGADTMKRDSLAIRLLGYADAVDAVQRIGDDPRLIAGSYCGSMSLVDDFTGPLAQPETDGPVSHGSHGGTCPFTTSQAMIRTELMRRMGGFDESLTQDEDHDLWQRILRSGYWFTPARPLGVTRQTSNSSAMDTAPAISRAALTGANRPISRSALTCPPRRLGQPASDCHRTAGMMVMPEGKIRQAPAVALTGIEERFGAHGEPERDRLWPPAHRAEIDILFVPHRAYHLWTIAIAAPALRDAGLKFAIVDISAQWGDDGVRAQAAAKGIPLIAWGEVALGDFAPRLIVVFNDWDHVTRPILIAAAEAGIATAAIVEGIQDYHDVDTGLVRHTYRTAQRILLPGDFDRRYFADDAAPLHEVVGIPRIQELRQQPKPILSEAGKRRVLINSNFSYDVLMDKRDEWLTSAVGAVRAAGFQPVISRHPADKGTLFPELVTSESFYDVLGDVAATIQRFASGILESLARDVPVIYYNPHQEKIDKFLVNPMGAYPVATHASELTAALADLPHWADAAKLNGAAFLDHHAGPVDLDCNAALAKAIAAAMGAKPDEDVRHAFRRNLRAIDANTASLTGGRQLFQNPVTATAQLQEMVRSLANPDEVITVNRQSLKMVAIVRSATIPEIAPAPSTRRGRDGGGADRPPTKRIVGARQLIWRLRASLHEAAAAAYREIERWPALHRRLRALRDFYTNHIAPF